MDREPNSPFSFNETKDTETGLTFVTLSYEEREDPRRSIQISVAPEYGSNLVEFRVGGEEIFSTDKEAIKNGMWTGCLVLWPLPNRYERDGKKAYIFDGQEVSLEDIQRKEGNRPLIHGLVDDQVWQYEKPVVTNEGVSFQTHIAITEESPLYKYFPFKSTLTLQFTIQKNAVVVTYTASNTGEKKMPSVFALHPYYRLLDGEEDALVCIPARSLMEATDELLPTGKLLSVKEEKPEADLMTAKPVKGTFFDDVWTDLEPGEYPSIDYTKKGLRISQRTTDDFTHVVYFTQKAEEKGFICLEPQTGSTNAINLDHQAKEQQNDALAKAAHLIVVSPGESHTGTATFLIEYTR